MVKKFLATTTILLITASVTVATGQRNSNPLSNNSQADVKSVNTHLENVDFAFSSSERKIHGPNIGNLSPRSFFNFVPAIKSFLIEEASSLQLKYSILLDTEVENIVNFNLFKAIDEWFGTKYLFGGTSKKGIDCSGFVQMIYAGLFGIALPRTARDQHKTTRKISRTELREGDLVFFNTRGGVSHVGIYLQNNKFVHSASSGGVMISDMDENYWSRKFIGGGRYEEPSIPSGYVFSQP